MNQDQDHDDALRAEPGAQRGAGAAAGADAGPDAGLVFPRRRQAALRTGAVRRQPRRDLVDRVLLQPRHPGRLPGE